MTGTRLQTQQSAPQDKATQSLKSFQIGSPPNQGAAAKPSPSRTSNIGPPNQRCGPFNILKKIGTLAYELDLPPTMGIHPVTSVASLEPAPKGKDPYDRRKNDEQPAVLDNDTEGTGDRFVIELLLDRRERRPKGRELVVE